MKKKIAAKKREEKQAAIDKVQNDPILCQTFAQYYKLPRYLKQKRRLEPKPTSKHGRLLHNVGVKAFLMFFHLRSCKYPKIFCFCH